MAIRFEWYENPVPPGKEDEKKLHARITLNGKTETARIGREIQERCLLTETDVKAVLDALSHILGRELGDGRQVHLDGIGYFYPTLKCTEEVTAETKRKNTKVRLKGIRFRADHQLMTRADFQQICGFMKSKAMAHIRRLRAEGKIRNIGLPTQPVYVPVAGYYGVSRDRIVRP